MSNALLNRLASVYDQSLVRQVMDATAQTRWRPGAFGDPFTDVKTIVTHQTAGWPSKIAASRFVTRYITLNFTEDGQDKWGIGTQFYISTDGTAFRLIDIPRITFHASFVNGWSLGVETGRTYRAIGPTGNNAWRQLLAGPEDAPGMKLYATSHPGQPPHEVLVCWFTTADYGGPGRTPISAGEMLFTEWQYRTWALLARYLCEAHLVPRNLPLLPFENRGDNIDDPERFRNIVLADNAFEMVVRGLSTFDVSDGDFLSGNLDALRADYRAAILPAVGPRARHNQVWLHFFDNFRGIHGHGFAGATHRVLNNKGVLVPADHDCPGPLFDWYRFAREISDWWWRPFDFRHDLGSTTVPIRAYRQARRDTPLIEYYFETREIAYFNRITAGLGGQTFSPATFHLEEGSPVYAMANGELIAARFPEVLDGVSMAFVLIRHEVFHLSSVLAQFFAEQGEFPRTMSDRIDYDAEPSYVYTLTMHLGRPAGMNFDQVTPANPDWLNRVLLRLKECELGIAFRATNPQGFLNTAWNSRPPGARVRPSIPEGWEFDQNHALRQFANDLKAGRLALAPHISDSWATSIRVLLGDFLGVAGRIAAPDGSVSLHGIHIEVFSRELISSADFSPVTTATNWTVPAGLPRPPALHYQSEWSLIPSGILIAILEALNIEPNLVNWWQEVASHTLSDTLLPLEARLPWDGKVWHYRPNDFLRWLNLVTWHSEWAKYRVTDPAGNLRPAPLVPRERRF